MRVPFSRIIAIGLCVVTTAGTSMRSTVRAGLVAITNVVVIDVSTGNTTPNATIIVDGTRFRAIGSAEATPAPNDARVIDGHGAYAIPGLADMHAHVYNPEQLWLYLARGVTTIRNLDGRPQHIPMRDAIASGSALGPTLITSGPIVFGVEAVWREIDDPAAAGDTLARWHKEAGYDLIKVYRQLTREQFDGIVAGAAHYGLPVAGHVPQSVGLDDALRAGMSIEHLTGYGTALDSAPPTDWNTMDPEAASFADAVPSRIPDIARKTAASNAWNCPTLVEFEIPGILGLSDSALSLVDPGERARVRTVRLNHPADLWTAAILSRRAVVGALNAAGARLLAGTDLHPDGGALVQELRALNASGLTPLQALQTATVNPALAMRQPEEFGRIAVGQRADLVLLDANPLSDLRALDSLRGVMVRGRWLQRSELVTLRIARLLLTRADTSTAIALLRLGETSLPRSFAVSESIAALFRNTANADAERTSRARAADLRKRALAEHWAPATMGGYGAYGNL